MENPEEIRTPEYLQASRARVVAGSGGRLSDDFVTCRSVYSYLSLAIALLSFGPDCGCAASCRCEERALNFVYGTCVRCFKGAREWLLSSSSLSTSAIISFAACHALSIARGRVARDLEIQVSWKASEGWYWETKICHRRRCRSTFRRGIYLFPHISRISSFRRRTHHIAIDCEMVGVGRSGLTSVLARVSVVNEYGAILLDTFVRQTQVVTDYRTLVSGVRREDVEGPDGASRRVFEPRRQFECVSDS